MKITKTTIQSLVDTTTDLSSDLYHVAITLPYHPGSSLALDCVAFMPVIAVCFSQNAKSLKLNRFFPNSAQTDLAYGLLSGGNAAARKVLEILMAKNRLNESSYEILVETANGQAKSTLQLLASLYMELGYALRANGVNFPSRSLPSFIVQLAGVPNRQLNTFLYSLKILSQCRGFLEAKRELARMGHVDVPIWNAKQFPLSALDIKALIDNYAEPEGAAIVLAECFANASYAGLNFSSLVKLMSAVLKEGAGVKLSLVNSAVDVFLSSENSALLRSTFMLALRNMDKLDRNTISQLIEVLPDGASACQITKEIIVGDTSYLANSKKLGFFEQGVELPVVDSAVVDCSPT